MESGTSTPGLLAQRPADLDGLTLASLARESGRGADLLGRLLTRLEERHFLASTWSAQQRQLEDLIHACDVILLGIAGDEEQAVQAVADGVTAEQGQVPSAVLVDERFLDRARSEAASRQLPDLRLVAVPTALIGADDAAASPDFSRVVREIEQATCTDPSQVPPQGRPEEGGGLSCLC